MGFEQVRDVQVVGLSCSVFYFLCAFGSRSGFQSLGSSVERVFWEFRVSRFGCPQVNFCSFSSLRVGVSEVWVCGFRAVLAG